MAPITFTRVLEAVWAMGLSTPFLIQPQTTLVAIVGWAGYTGYNYYEDNKPAQTYYTNTSALSSYVSGLNTEAQ